jgi:hypothetical protein
MFSPVADASADGIRTPFSNGVKTPIHGVFYCLKKIVAAKIRAFVMVAHSGQPQGWPAPLPGSSNLLCAAAQRLKSTGGGYPFFSRNTVMNIQPNARDYRALNIHHSPAVCGNSRHRTAP